MRKKQFGRKIAAIAMATAMAISAAFSGGVNGGTRVHAAPEGATVPVRQDSASSINYSSILGRAVDYGIVAENFKQMNHMESTFAVKNYASLKGDANDIDKLDPKATAHVLVGALDKANSGGTAPIKDEAPDDFVPAEYSLNNSNDQFNVRSIINVGSCSAKTMIFEGPNAVLTDNYICVDNVKDKPKDELDFRWKYNEATDASIDLIINKAFDSSAKLKAKCDDPAYRINYREYMNGKDLDLSGESFVDKVVYVDVDSELLEKMSQAEGLTITKEASTVIVFTVSDEDGTNFVNPKTNENTVCLNKFKVSVVGGAQNILTDDDNKYVDEEVCQKIIWNITTSAPVRLCNTAGLVIVPNAKVDVYNTSRGWIVAKDLTNSFGEWHYLYKGISQDVNDDAYNQMHFSVRKAFTRDWGTADSSTGYTRPEEDSSVFIEGGDYTFEFYKADRYNINPNLSTNGLTLIKEVSNQDTSYVKFPKLTFFAKQSEAEADSRWNHDPNYVIPDGETHTFYYLIKEKNVGTDKGSVEISDGYINIQLNVKNDNGTFLFNVTTDTYLGNESHSKYFHNENVAMSGVEFDLDDFFNKVGKSVEIDKVAIAGGPEIGGAKLSITSKNNDYPFLIYSIKATRDGSTVDVSYDDSNSIIGVLKYNTISYETVAGDQNNDNHTIINGLPDGDYILTETTCPNGFAQAESIEFSVKNGIVSGKNVNANTITMVDKVVVNLTKVDEYNAAVTGATLQILDKDKKVVSTVTGDTVALEAGEYYLHEENAPEGYKKAEDIAFTVDSDGKIYDADGKEFANRTVKMVDEHVTDFYISKVSVTGSANDELKGATISLTGKDYNNEDIIFESNNVVAGQGASIETTLPANKVVFISGTSSTLFKNLPDGNYEMKELVAPTDYSLITTTMKFTVKNGVVTSSDSNVSIRTNSSDSKQVVVMADNLIEKGNLELKKTISGGVTEEEAEGALKFQVTKGTGTDKKYLTKEGKLTTEETTLKLSDSCASHQQQIQMET